MSFKNYGLAGFALIQAMWIFPLQNPQDEACAEAPPTPGIMSVAFANEKSGESHLQRIFVGSAEDFAKGHLANSALLDLAWIRGEVNGVKSELLPPKQWVGKLAEQGIESRFWILLYGAKVTDMALAGWALTNAGHTQWYILDGGLPAWKAAGHEIQTEGKPGLGKKGEFVVAEAKDFQARLPEVEKASRGEGPKLLDSRPAEQNASGFIPRSINIPWPSLLKQDGTFKPIPELRKIFADAGIRADEDLIVYCNTGHQASAEYFALRYLLGYQKTRIYDGSLAEWKLDSGRQLIKP